MLAKHEVGAVHVLGKPSTSDTVVSCDMIDPEYRFEARGGYVNQCYG